VGDRVAVRYTMSNEMPGASSDDPREAPPGARSAAVPLGDLPVPGSPPPHLPEAPQTPSERLPAVGTLPANGALADGRHGRGGPAGRRRAQGDHRDR